jgi:hypothetical protein
MNIDSVLKMIEQEFAPPPIASENVAAYDDIPDFLLVANRVPLTAEQKAKLDAIKAEAAPSPEEKWQRNRRLYEVEGQRLKLLAAEKAKPAKEAFFAAKKAEADEIKAVKDAAKAAHRKESK